MRLFLGILLRLLIVVPPVIFTSMIAWNASERIQPDENMHIDAFTFFESHWTRPEVNSDEVYYSPMGISRVYSGEIVYLLYGRIGSLIHRHYPDLDPYTLYRFVNVSLLLITLSILAFVRCELFPPWLLALFLVCIPQVPYIYSYANSDAFGVSISIFLFLFAVHLLQRQPRQWRWWRIVFLFLLFLTTLLTKPDFLMAILLPCAIIIFHLIRTRTSPLFVFLRLIIPFVLVYIVAAWWNPQLSPRRASWQAQLDEMKQEHGIPGRRPEGWHDANYYMASQGATYHQMIARQDYFWLSRTGQSFYSRFGAWRVQHPAWIFDTAAWIGITGLILTLAAQLVFRNQMPWELMLCLLLSPPLIAFSLFCSIYQSLHLDYQPQGRYLFGALIPIFLLFAGTWKIENKWWRGVHAILFILLLAMSYYSLLVLGATNPELTEAVY